MTQRWRPPERVDGWKFVDAAAPDLGIVLLLVTAAGFLAAIYIATGWFGIAVTGALVILPVLAASRRKKKQRSSPEARNARRRGMGPGAAMLRRGRLARPCLRSGATAIDGHRAPELRWTAVPPPAATRETAADRYQREVQGGPRVAV
jgi:hypothetical protein